MNRGGQSYLIVSFILVVIMATVAFTSKTMVHHRTEGHFLMENIERELPLTYTAGVYQDDLNSILTETSNEFRTFAQTKGYKMKMVFAATETIGIAVFYYIGNWWGEDCTYYNSRIGPVSIPDQSTVLRPRAWFLNDYDLIVCGQTLDLMQDFDYRAEVHRKDEVIVSG